MGAEEIVSFVRGLSPLQIGGGVLVLLAVFYVRRIGIVLSHLGIENRKLKRGLASYEQLEQQHFELSQENRDRNQFHASLPMLISRLGDERTVPAIARELVSFTARVLGASEVTLLVAEGGALVVRAAHGLSAPSVRVRIGEGRIGAVAQFRRVFAQEDFQNLDPASRERLLRSASRLDTVAAAPLLAHGQLLGVLNVGGTVTAATRMRKEALSVIANLGATALENQLNFERLEREATTDGLTGLANVTSFKEKLHQELARATRYGRPLSVFLFDIDHFKQYNDQNGHPAGDECLRATAELVRGQSRITDLIARYGGEEFIVLLPETDGAGGLKFAEKIRAA
ncbi:MAG: GGDEF domain-containing protein, partial [Candidatus Binatia bacterium]